MRRLAAALAHFLLVAWSALLRGVLALTDPRRGSPLRVAVTLAALTALCGASFLAVRAGILSRYMLMPAGAGLPHTLGRPTPIRGGGFGGGDGAGEPAALHHITVATRAEEGVYRFVRSLAWHGDDVKLLGGGDPRFQAWGKGFGVKVEQFLTFARSVPPDDLILMTDAYDVIMLRGHEGVLAGYARALARLEGTPDPAGAARRVSLLVSAERLCSPDAARAAAYPAADRATPFPYLNSGTFIGRAGSLVALLSSDSMDLDTNDQVFFTGLYLRSLTDASLPRVALDHGNDVFLVLTGPAMRWADEVAYDPAARVWRHGVTGGTPSVFHAPGWTGFKDIGVVWNAVQGRYCADVPCGTDAPLLTYVGDHVVTALVAGGTLGLVAPWAWPLMLSGLKSSAGQGVVGALLRAVAAAAAAVGCSAAVGGEGHRGRQASGGRAHGSDADITIPREVGGGGGGAGRHREVVREHDDALL